MDNNAIFVRRLFQVTLIVLILARCASATHIDENPIGHFLELTSATKSSDLIIVREKITTNRTIEIFKGTTPFTKERERFMQTGITEPLFNEAAFKVMVSKYYDVGKTANDWSMDEWSLKEFGVPIYNLMTYKEFNHLDITEYNIDREIYAFSDVIRYGKYYVFTYSRNYTRRHYFSSFIVVVMDKTNGKWQIKQQVNLNFD